MLGDAVSRLRTWGLVAKAASCGAASRQGLELSGLPCHSPFRGPSQDQKSDSLIFMSHISATEAARNFSDLLDAVEHRGEHFTVIRRGKVVAYLAPAGGNGLKLKGALRSLRPDGEWLADLEAVRESPVQER